MSGAKRDFVLVHGAWAGNWVWHLVKPLLEAAGHRVYAPTLTGLAERSHLLDPDVDRSTHVADVTTLIDFFGLTDIVLVGHSYGGLVISGVAQAVPEGTIGSIVYLDALMPPFPTEGAPALVLPEVDGTIPPPPPDAFGYDPGREERLIHPLTPMPAKTLLPATEPATRLASIPRKTYVAAGRNVSKALIHYYHSVRDDPDWDIHVLDTTHDIMLTEPEETARILREAAR